MLQRRLADRVRGFLRTQYGIEQANVVLEQPPKVEFGEYALPIAFELAKQLRKAPRKIAEEIVAGLGPVPGFLKFEIAGAGYINASVNRGEVAAALAADKHETAELNRDKILVEHTSINPNKAAHIGHLRNAILGDTFVRLLRESGRHVDVQNYIDNTGVQVADVVVGFMHLEKKSKQDIAEMIRKSSEGHRRDGQSFDYYCWDLYAKVSQWYEKDDANKKIRLDTLHAIEQGGNEATEIAELVSTAVLRRHLETMERLDIEYDFLPRESEILHLNFGDAAFELMKKKGVLTHIEAGKNKGCWVMVRAGGTMENEEDQKVIVRSNNTVTYVGKDIAYHLWKFGLLPGKDFGYRKFFGYRRKPFLPEKGQARSQESTDIRYCWISTDISNSELGAPHFGGVKAIYNVIDSRQADPQNNVIEALRLLGYEDAAKNYTHFSYEMVALTPRCAAELGYVLSPDEQQKSYVEVSGRKGFGVKADDLLDRLIEAAQKEVESRHPELSEKERRDVAEKIAIGALRYFMLKFTKQSVIAFDFKEALSFEGETGPYSQYAVVRASNIFRKAGVDPNANLSAAPGMNSVLENDDEIWDIWLTAGKLEWVVNQAIATTEPAYLAKDPFHLTEKFNKFYP